MIHLECQIKPRHDVTATDVLKIVHPSFLATYCNQTRIKHDFELISGHCVLLVEGLPAHAGVLDPTGEVRRDLPFGLRSVLNIKLNGPPKQAAMTSTRRPEKRSPFDDIPPLSASVVEYEKAQKKIPVEFPTIQEMLDNPELQAIKPVNIDPVSMAADDAATFIEEGREFIEEPTWGGAAMMAAIALPGKWADDAAKRLLVTVHPNAHSIARHGGSVTDKQLMHRALTGVAPDGHVKVIRGKTILPPMSSAFHSDDLLIYADQSVRNNGILQSVIDKNPGKTFITVKPEDAGDLGANLGRGFKRISGSKLNPDLQGAPNIVENLRSVQATYELNPDSGMWETITIFPAR